MDYDESTIGVEDVPVSSSPVPFPREATVLAASCAVVLSAVGLAGNLLSIMALLRSRKLRSQATTAFVLSLCGADLLFCAINLPATASRYIHEAWVLGEPLCRLFPFFFYGNVAASLMSMVAIAINRYVLISWHGVYERVYGRGWIVAVMILMVWSFSFSMLAPPLAEVWGRLGLDPPTFSCTILPKDGRSPKKFLFVFGFLLPCLAILVCYGCIYRKVRRSRTALLSHTHSKGDGKTASVSSTPSPKRDDLRLTRMMVLIFCTFLLCFLPLMLVNVADDQLHYPTVHILASILAWASSVVNPLIYFVSNRQYRQAFRELLCIQDGTSGGNGVSNGHSRSFSNKTCMTEMAHMHSASTQVHILALRPSPSTPPPT